MTYVNMDELPSSVFIKLAAKRLGFPMVIKECYGSLGGQVYLANNQSSAKLVNQNGSKAVHLSGIRLRKLRHRHTDYVVDGSRWQFTAPLQIGFRSISGWRGSVGLYPHRRRKRGCGSLCKSSARCSQEWTFCLASAAAGLRSKLKRLYNAIRNAPASTCPGLL